MTRHVAPVHPQPCHLPHRFEEGVLGSRFPHLQRFDEGKFIGERAGSRACFEATRSLRHLLPIRGEGCSRKVVEKVPSLRVKRDPDQTDRRERSLHTFRSLLAELQSLSLEFAGLRVLRKQAARAVQVG